MSGIGARRLKSSPARRELLIANLFLLGLMGIGTVAFIATRSVQILIMGQRLKQRQLMQTISKLSDHYILCG